MRIRDSLVLALGSLMICICLLDILAHDMIILKILQHWILAVKILLLGRVQSEILTFVNKLPHDLTLIRNGLFYGVAYAGNVGDIEVWRRYVALFILPKVM